MANDLLAQLENSRLYLRDEFGFRESAVVFWWNSDFPSVGAVYCLGPRGDFTRPLGLVAHPMGGGSIRARERGLRP